MKVHKYRAAIGAFTLELPELATIVSVGAQAGQPKMWIEVDDEDDLTLERKYYGAVTGEDLPDGYTTFVGTVLLDGGAFVLHIYEDEH